MEYKINVGKCVTGIDIKKIEKYYGGKYIGDFCLKTISGDWSEEPASVFFQSNPNTSLGHTNYFGIIKRPDGSYITKGDSAFSEPLLGITDSSGEVIYSRFRHDFRTLESGLGFIDGGRDYSKTNISDKIKYVHLHIDGDHLVVRDINEIQLESGFKV